MMDVNVGVVSCSWTRMQFVFALGAVIAAVVMLGSRGVAQPSPYDGCRKLTKTCIGTCSSWQWYCVAAPCSLRPLSMSR